MNKEISTEPQSWLGLWELADGMYYIWGRAEHLQEHESLV